MTTMHCIHCHCMRASVSPIVLCCIVCLRFYIQNSSRSISVLIVCRAYFGLHWKPTESNNNHKDKTRQVKASVIRSSERTNERTQRMKRSYARNMYACIVLQIVESEYHLERAVAARYSKTQCLHVCICAFLLRYFLLCVVQSGVNKK